MKKTDFITKVLELGAELEKTDDGMKCNMIINDANILYDRFMASQPANGVDTKQKPALHKHIVNRWDYLFDNWQPIMLGIAMALAFNVIVTMFENVIVKIALIIHGG